MVKIYVDKTIPCVNKFQNQGLLVSPILEFYCGHEHLKPLRNSVYLFNFVYSSVCKPI